MAVPNLTANSPAAGSIAWSAFNIRYGGVTYAVAAGSTSQRYVWWRFNAGSPVLTAGAAVPTNLTDDDLVLFVNKDGIPVNVQASSVVEGSLIVDGSIVGAAIAAGTIQGDRIKAGTLTADLIAAGAVTADKVAVGDFTNYIADGDVSDPTFGNWDAAGGLSRATPAGESAYIYWTTSATNAHRYNKKKFEVTPGDRFYFTGEVSTPASNTKPVDVVAAMQTYTTTGTTATWPQLAAKTLAPGTGWTTYSGVITIPDGTSVRGVFDPFTLPTTPAGQEVRMRRMSLRRMLTGELIVDGSIKSSMIETTGLDASVIKVGTMHGDRIAAGTLSIGKTSGLQGALDAKAATAYVLSRGTDLVTNGTGYLGDATNFAGGFTANLTDVPTGATASFYAKATGSTSVMNDELIPFDPAKKYRFAFKMRQTVAGATTRSYGFLAPYDAWGNNITPSTYMFQPGTTTTLAAPLANGDTVIKLTDASNWYGQTGKPATTNTHYRSMILWNWVDPNGKAWPPHTYTRHPWFADTWADGGVDLATNTITLKAPWTGGAFPAGHPVSNGSSGGSFLYMPSLVNGVVPETWTTYADIFDKGIMADATAAAGRLDSSWAKGLPPATANVKIGWLVNYPPSPSNPIVGRHAVAAVSFSDASAAQSTADAAPSKAIELDATNLNSTFSAWSGTLPDYWPAWGTTTVQPTKNTADAITGGAALQWDSAAVNNGIGGAGSFAALPLGLKYVTVEMDVQLKSGTFDGAGLLLDWSGMSGSVRSRLLLKDVVPSPALGKWYRVSAVLKRPTDVGTHTSWGVYLMANFNELGALTAKNIIFDRVAARPSSVEEITAYEAPADATAKANAARTNAVGDVKTLWGHPSDTTLIDGGDIYTNSIKATAIQLADWNNYFPDRYFNLSSDPYFNNATRYTAVTPPAGGAGALLAARDHIATSAPRIAARPGDEFLISATYRKVAGNLPPILGVWQTRMDGSDTVVVAPFDNEYRTQVGTDVDLGGGWFRVTYKARIRSTATDTAFVRPWIMLAQTVPYTATTAVTDIVVLKRNGGDLLVDGAITTTKLATDAVEAVNIKASAVESDKIAANAVTANKLNVVVGGGNQWSNSSFENATDYLTGWTKYDNGAVATASKVAGRLSGSAVRLTWTTPDGNLLGLYRGHPAGGWKANQKYTVSFYARASGGAVGKTIAHAANAPQPTVTWNLRPSLTIDWQRYSMTFTRPSDTTDAIFWGVVGLLGAGAGTVEYDDVQLEDGDITTAYAPQVDEILPGTIRTAMLDAGAVTTDKLFAEAVTAAKIKAGDINAGHIAAGAITTEKLSVGSIGDNIILNGNFRDLTNGAGSVPLGWAAEAGAGTAVGNVYGTDTYLEVQTGSSINGASVYQNGFTGGIPCSAGDQFHVEVGAVSTTAGQQFALIAHTYNRDGVYRGRIDSAALTTLALASFLPSSNRKSAVITIPAGDIALVRFGLTPMTASTKFLFDKYTVGKVSVSARIADGAITAAKILAKAVTAAKIDTNAVRANHVEAGAITADKIHLGAKGFAVNDNSNFEQEATDPVTDAPLGYPAGWQLYQPAAGVSLSLEKASPLSGSQSARVTVPANTVARLQMRVPSYMQVNAGEKWYVSVRVKATGGDNVAFDPLHVTFHTSQPGTDPYALFVGSAATWQDGPHQAISNGEDKVLNAADGTSPGMTFTVPAGHTIGAISVRLPPRTAAATYLVEDFVAHPAIDNGMVTDISAGKITTGFIQAGQRIVAGTSLTGARAEMTDSGFFAYNGSGARTFTVQGNDGTAVVGNPGAINISMSAYANAWNFGASQAMIRFNYPGTGWGEGALFSQYWSDSGRNWAAVRLQSPYNAGMANGLSYSAFLDVRSNDAGYSQFFLRAQEANFSGTTFIWGSGDGSSIDFRAYGTRASDGTNVGFTFGDWAMSSRLNLYPRIGFFLLRAADANGNAQQLRLQGSQASVSVGGQELYFDTNGVQPALGHFERNMMLEFHTGGSIRAVNWARSGFIPLSASAFNVTSDPRMKTNVTAATGGLDAVRSIEVYDYDMEGILPRVAEENPKTDRVTDATGKRARQRRRSANRARGVMADQVRDVLPDAVHEDETGQLTVSLYDLLATTMAAVKELDAEVRDLRAAASTRHKP